jgi:hypothetical protein
MSHFIVKEATAKMPSSCWGKYKRVAVLEVENGVFNVSMISDKAKGVVQVVATWERLHVGTTPRCAYRQALQEAEEMARSLNSPMERLAAVGRAG